MIKYTQANFDALERDADGYLHLPSGDWSDVDFGETDKLVFANDCELGDCCTFGNYCKFGDWCEFGDHCKLGGGCEFGDNFTFGDWCEFGDHCKLGGGCEFGDHCKFGDGCEFGDHCKLGGGCEFGDHCKFGDGCVLGYSCKLGDDCTLGNDCTLSSDCKAGNWCKIGTGCSMENGAVQNATVFKVSNIGSRNGAAYCYCNTLTGDIYVRTGCWFSDVDDFVERVHDVHAGTQHEDDYLAMVEFAKARFAQYRAGRNDYV